MFIKIQKSYRDVIAVCDSGLIGKYFEDEKFQLNLKESFYKGEEVSEEQALAIIQDQSQEDATFNIVGEKSITLALKAKIIEEKGIKKIAGIPFALILI